MTPTQLNILIYFGIIFFLLISAFLIILKRKKLSALLNTGMNLALFLVTVPQEGKTDKEKEIPLEQCLKTTEQFYSSLAGIKEKGFIKRIFGRNPYFVFELSVHRLGEEIHFYFACPYKFSQLMEKQILAFWPKAQVQPISDYNIFNPTGYSAGSRAILAQSPIFPIKTFKDFSTDPLSSITSVFTKLVKEGEGAAFQILVKPSRRSLKKPALSKIQSVQKGAKSSGKEISSAVDLLLRGKPPQEKEVFQPRQEITPIQQEIISAVSQKSSRILFEVNIRLVASAQNQERAQSILSQLESSFEQFNSPILNQFKFKKLSPKALKRFFYNFSFRLFNENEKIILSSDELAGIFRFPSPSLFTPHIKWLKTKQAPPPSNLPEDGIVIGKNVFRGEEKTIKMLKEDRGRHFYVVGQTGTGKSALMQEMIRQDIESGEGLALIDPHGDLAEKIISLIPPNRAEDVIYFNPGDSEKPIGLNMLDFDQKYPESKTFVVNELIEIFEKLYNLKTHGFGGPVFEQYMRNSLLLVMEDLESGSTLIEIPRVLADPNFRKYKLSRCQNIIVKNFWELEAQKAGGEASLANMVPYITSKLNIFIANDLVRPIISQQKSAFNFREIMDSGKILIVNLSKGRLGDINSYLLGMIIVGKLLIAAMSRVDIPEEKQRKDFYLYIDEFHNVITKTVASILAEARKYRLNMIFAHQFIGQIDEETRKAIFGNVGSMISFRVGPEDAKFLTTEFEPYFNENDLVNLDNYNAALRLLIKGETSKPFSLVTFPPKQGNPETAQIIKKYSRTKYGRSRSLVEAELNERLQKSYSNV